jgi:hypothetical protein
MATKKKTEKKAKKFQYTRAQISERITALEETLDSLDTFEMSPSEVADRIAELSSELNDVGYELTEEKYESAW